MRGWVKQRRLSADDLWTWQRVELVVDRQGIAFGPSDRLDFADVERVCAWQSGFDVVPIGAGSLSFIAESVDAAAEWVAAIHARIHGGGPEDEDDEGEVEADALNLLEHGDYYYYSNNDDTAKASRRDVDNDVDDDDDGGAWCDESVGGDSSLFETLGASPSERAAEEAARAAPQDVGFHLRIDEDAAALEQLEKELLEATRALMVDEDEDEGAVNVDEPPPPPALPRRPETQASSAVVVVHGEDAPRTRKQARAPATRINDNSSVRPSPARPSVSSVRSSSQVPTSTTAVRHSQPTPAAFPARLSTSRSPTRQSPASPRASSTRKSPFASTQKSPGVLAQGGAATTRGTVVVGTQTEDESREEVVQLTVDLAAAREEVAAQSMRRVADASAHAAQRRAELEELRMLKAQNAALKAEKAEAEAHRDAALDHADKHGHLRAKAEGLARRLAAQNVQLAARTSAARDVANTERAAAAHLARRVEILVDENAHLENERHRVASEKATLQQTLERHDKLIYGNTATFHPAQHLLSAKKKNMTAPTLNHHHHHHRGGAAPPATNHQKTAPTPSSSTTSQRGPASYAALAAASSSRRTTPPFSASAPLLSQPFR